MADVSPVVLIHATVPWPLTARLAIRFRDLGCRVHSLCPSVHPLHHVGGIEGRHALKSWSLQRSLIEAIEESHADYLVPGDDRAVLQLHALAASHPQYRALLAKSLGDPTGFAVVRNRTSILNLANSLDILAPRTVPLRSDREARDYASSWSYPAVIKRDGTFGGQGVVIVTTPKELIDAYRKLRRDPSMIAKLKRRIVDDDILAFYQPDELPPEEISLQQYVFGTPANAMYSCYRGKILASIQVRTVCAQHATGSALIVERINYPRIEEAGGKLAKALSLSGFMGLDFVLDDKSGLPYLLEMNPRASQLGHLPLNESNGDSCLAQELWRAWSDATTPKPVAQAKPTAMQQRIAFFPQSLVLGSDHSQLVSAWLDRPDEDPDLVRELSKPSWPQRSAIYKLFHKFYAVQPAQPVFFGQRHFDTHVKSA